MMARHLPRRSPGCFMLPNCGAPSAAKTASELSAHSLRRECSRRIRKSWAPTITAVRPLLRMDGSCYGVTVRHRLIFREAADAEGFQEPALSRRGHDHGAAVLHSLGP